MRFTVNRFVEKLERSWIPLIVANIFIAFAAPFTTAYYDYRYFEQWYDIAIKYGLSKTYTLAAKTAYFPLTVYTFLLFHWLGLSLASLLKFEAGPLNPVVVLVDKIPFILSFNLIYLVLRRRYGYAAGLLWLINLSAYSTLAGFQFDLLVALLILLSMILLEEGKAGKSLLLASLVTLLKQIFVFTALVPFAYILKRHGLRRALVDAFVYFVAPIVLFSLPFLLYDPVDFVAKSLLFHGLRYPQDLSLWAVPLYAVSFNVQLLPEFITWAWVVPFAAFMAYLFYKLVRIGVHTEKALFYYVLVVSGILVLNKVGGLNYLTWLTPLLIAMSARLGGDLGLKLRKVSVALPMWSLAIYPFFTFYTAVIVGGDIYIVEDSSWEPAEGIFYASYGYHNPLAAIISLLKSSPTSYFIFRSLYNAMPLTSIMVTLVYNAAIIYVMRVAWRSAGW
ncbi:hypothetical protein [Thermogladius sp.]|uniref:hypothetical protein n=1 Tax=Thermogladius sp. TaxID=2023064 RepID=UPI003D0E8F9B